MSQHGGVGGGAWVIMYVVVALALVMLIALTVAVVL